MTADGLHSNAANWKSRPDLDVYVSRFGAPKQTVSEYARNGKRPRAGCRTLDAGELIDDAGCPDQHGIRNANAQGSRRLEVENEIELRDLVDREIGRLRALEDRVECRSEGHTPAARSAASLAHRRRPARASTPGKKRFEFALLAERAALLE